MRIESFSDPSGIRFDIVISENRHYRDPGTQLRQQLGARLGRFSRAFRRVESAMKHRNCDEVASQDDQIRMQVIDDFYGSSDWHSRAFVVVKVAELRDGQAVEGGGQPGQHDFNRPQNGVVRFENYAIFPEGQSARRGHSGGNLKKPASS